MLRMENRKNNAVVMFIDQTRVRRTIVYYILLLLLFFSFPLFLL